jgi:hypothetical protein
MNLWFFVLLVVTIALVLGPISMLRPNPAQKRKEQLRMQASAQGIRFGMRRLPARKTDMEQPPVLPVYFLPPPTTMQSMDDWVLMRTEYEHEGNFYKEWDWQGNARPIPQVSEQLASILSTLPHSVPAIAQGKSGTCIFWRETEGEEVLIAVIAVLRNLDALIREAKS